MYRYEVYLYSNQKLVTFTDKDNTLKDSKRYIQILGFVKNIDIVHSFWELDNLDLSKLKGYKPCLVLRNGLIKILSSRIKEVRRVEIWLKHQKQFW